ncbi:MAG: transposase, partial [Oscillospiraceae bacterium]|nr:transposase [Oscillospiraceae bacterium]
VVSANDKVIVEMHLSGGNCHDAPQGRTSIEYIGSSYSGVPILMDRAYERNKTRELCQSLGHDPVVPPKKNRLDPWEYYQDLYKQRNIIERLFRWLKAFRQVCTRYDKLDLIFLSFIQIACIVTWLK